MDQELQGYVSSGTVSLLLALADPVLTLFIASVH